jgi:hypothetical protein
MAGDLGFAVMTVYHDTVLRGAGALNQGTLNTHALADWDGQVEISRCVDTREDGAVRIEDAEDEHSWLGAPYWSVYLHQHAGGVDGVADLRTQEQAEAFAAGLIVFREWQRSWARGT